MLYVDLRPLEECADGCVGVVAAAPEGGVVVRFDVDGSRSFEVDVKSPLGGNIYAIGVAFLAFNVGGATRRGLECGFFLKFHGWGFSGKVVRPFQFHNESFVVEVIYAAAVGGRAVNGDTSQRHGFGTWVVLHGATGDVASRNVVVVAGGDLHAAYLEAVGRSMGRERYCQKSMAIRKLMYFPIPLFVVSLVFIMVPILKIVIELLQR